jgi:Methyltransferase domain
LITYRHSDGAQMQLIAELGTLMDQGARRFCDVGGGANPIVSTRKIKQLGLEYVLLDDSAGELEKAPDEYQTFQASMLDPLRISELLQSGGSFDVVTSRWTAEHMPDGRAFHGQVFAMLKPGGAAVHLFPTLYSPPFLVNHLLPDALSSRLLDSSGGGGRVSEGRHPKFPSYYSWCRGPSRRQLARLESVGFTVESYTGFYGHGYYRRVKPLDGLHRRITTLLLAHPLASLTSFALIVLRRQP